MTCRRRAGKPLPYLTVDKVDPERAGYARKRRSINLSWPECVLIVAIVVAGLFAGAAIVHIFGQVAWHAIR